MVADLETQSNEVSGAHHLIVTHLSKIADRLEKKFGLSRVKPILLSRYDSKMSDIKKNVKRLDNDITYYQAWFNGRKIFIKHGGDEGSCQKEFEYSSRLNKINKDNFIEVLFYSEAEDGRCIASEFLEGKTLESTIRSADFSPAERENFIIQLKIVAQCLLEAGVVHRDAGADNFIVTKEGKLKLIDFGQAVDSKQYGVCSGFRRDSLFFRRVCVKCTGRFHCCDVFILPMMLERIGCQKSYQETYYEVESFLSKYPETLTVRCKYRFIFYRILFKLRKIFRRFFPNA